LAPVGDGAEAENVGADQRHLLLADDRIGLEPWCHYEVVRAGMAAVSMAANHPATCWAESSTPLRVESNRIAVDEDLDGAAHRGITEALEVVGERPRLHPPGD